MFRFFLLCTIVVLLLPFEVVAKNARILALGDSFMAWHRGSGQSIADSVAESLGEPVQNRSISGARITYPLPISGAMGMRIANQYRGEKVDWVIMTGGGNDFMLGCGCGKCAKQMNRMIAQNADEGDVVALIKRIRATGARVVYVGYLRSPGIDSPIEGCKDEGDAFEARLAQLAETDGGIFFLSNAELVPHGDRSFHGADMIHPSRKASQIIGQRVAQIIKGADKR